MDKKKELLRASGKLSGDWTVASEGEIMVIEFRSDEYTTGEGFLLGYNYGPKGKKFNIIILKIQYKNKHQYFLRF